jgi:hypothetical protein
MRSILSMVSAIMVCPKLMVLHIGRARNFSYSMFESDGELCVHTWGGKFACRSPSFVADRHHSRLAIVDDSGNCSTAMPNSRDDSLLRCFFSDRMQETLRTIWKVRANFGISSRFAIGWISIAVVLSLQRSSGRSWDAA